MLLRAPLAKRASGKLGLLERMHPIFSESGPQFSSRSPAPDASVSRMSRGSRKVGRRSLRRQPDWTSQRLQSHKSSRTLARAAGPHGFAVSKNGVVVGGRVAKSRKIARSLLSSRFRRYKSWWIGLVSSPNSLLGTMSLPCLLIGRGVQVLDNLTPWSLARNETRPEKTIKLYLGKGRRRTVVPLCKSLKHHPASACAWCERRISGPVDRCDSCADVAHYRCLGLCGICRACRSYFCPACLITHLTLP